MNRGSFFPNVLHGDKWKLTFSNIPTLDDNNDMRYFDNYIKSCTLPNYTVGEILSQLPMGMQIRHPLGGMKRNQDLAPLNVSFVVSEDMYNYITLFKWMQQIRYGQINKNHTDFFRKYTIKRIILTFLDNQKRDVAEMVFTNVFVSDIGALDLIYGQTDELSFTCNFVYEEIFYNIKNPMSGGKELETPEPIIECGTSGVPINPMLDWLSK
jgi:hypothetical protein